MTDYISIDAIVGQNSPQGTAVPNGMNFGDFQTDVTVNFNPGVSSGNAYPWLYTIMPKTDEPASILLTDYTIPASSSGYIPLSTFNQTDPYVTILGNGSDKVLSLKTAVNLFFSVSTDDQNIVFTNSGYDQHKQKMVAQTPPLTSSASPVTSRILKDYSSIFYQNNTNTPAQVTIKLGMIYELRFFDLIQNSVLFVAARSPFYTAPSADAKIVWDFDYAPVANNPLLPIAITDPSVRPLIDFTNSGNSDLVAGRTLMIMQNVFGMGNFPTIPASSYAYPTYIPDLTNNLRTVIGAEQPTTGWTGWQG